MLIAIDALNRDRFGAVLDEMFRLRARVFADRLGWEVTIENGMEIDRFDALDPAYLVGLDNEGHVVSCARLLQTTGPHMLADVFASILDGEPPLRSSRIWESTRFCVDTARLKETGGLSGISRATCEILIGINDYGMMAGITDVVTVIDPVMDRVLKRSGCGPYDYVGSKKPMGKVSALAALLDCTDERSQSVRAFSGIMGSVFLSDDEALEIFARNPVAQPSGNVVAFPLGQTCQEAKIQVSTDQILEYCVSQIQKAQTPSERQAAVKVTWDLLNAAGLAEQFRVLIAALSSKDELINS